MPFLLLTLCACASFLCSFRETNRNLSVIPPTTIPDAEQIKQVNARWSSLDIKPTKHFIGTPQGMMRVWWESPESAADGGAGEALGEQTGM